MNANEFREQLAKIPLVPGEAENAYTTKPW